MENTQQVQPTNHVFTYLLVAFFAVFIGSGIFLVINNNKSRAPVNSNEVNNTVNTADEKTSATEVQPDEASLSLQSDLPDSSTTISTQFSLDLLADSKTKNIVGYDIILSYDPLAFEFLKADSLLADYKIYSYKKDGFITLTATKNLQSPASPLSNSKIAKLFFKPTKAGQYTFSLKSVNGNEKTDFITDQTEILKPSLNDLIVNVK